VSFAAASRLFMQPLVCYGIAAEELWRRSVMAAIAAEILARRTDADSNLCYTAGLLHAVGLVVIDTWARNQEAGPRLASTGYPSESVAQELATLGFTNASVAGALLRLWKFPEAMTEPIRWQFDPKAAPQRHQAVACVLSAAKWLRDAAPAAATGKALPRYPDDWILQRLRLNGSELESMIEETQSSFAEATRLLVEMGTSPGPVQLRTA
jgi:HD-like signal output (HDOD) protein